VYLRAVTQDDYTYLRMIETSSRFAPRWRLRGSTPGPQEWAQGSSAGLLAQFMVVARKSGSLLGVVTAYRPDFQDGHVRLAAMTFDPTTRSPLMALGVGLFIEYVFRCWNFRKIYVDVAEYNFHQMSSGLASFFTLEGRLRDHYYLDGQYWDHFVLAILRETWESHPKRFLKAELSQPALRVTSRAPEAETPQE
jgi:hypothetical protein